MTARVGLIIPSSNHMVEQEMAGYFPPGVQLHIARLRMTGKYHAALDQLLPRVEEATRTLTDARCDVVVFHCTANSTAEGLAGEQRLLAAVKAGGAPQATTTATAIRKAFDALAARRIVLVTPYSARVTEEEAEFLRAAGYDVLNAVGCALDGSDAYCATLPQFWREQLLKAARSEADAYFLSCANISAFGIIDEIERQLDRPIVTSNQAVLWDALCRLGWRDRRGCPGRLFQLAAHAAPARQRQSG